MSAAQELQEEEREVLRSIYEGDDNYKGVNDTTHQYKVGEDGQPQSFLLEILWGEDYPDQLPEISLEAFYNKNIGNASDAMITVPRVKEVIIEKLKEQGEMFLGCAMTYSLFEWAKENLSELMTEVPDAVVQQASGDSPLKEPTLQEKKTKERKEQLTKSQKRRIINRIDLKTGEKPRGWDWVDITRHLSQTGGAAVPSK